ncbi:hypothetical protein [Streptomyces sp. NBS 14/10]|uniref:hypothetical protein n=1 Tax=Streptomyces sp. NBS 14/10 TaxID=1945643 RepID=UPI0015C687B9
MSEMIASGQVPSLAVQTAVMIRALLPVAVLSPFVQRHFKKGMLIGAINASLGRTHSSRPVLRRSPIQV